MIFIKLSTRAHKYSIDCLLKKIIFTAHRATLIISFHRVESIYMYIYIYNYMYVYIYIIYYIYIIFVSLPGTWSIKGRGSKIIIWNLEGVLQSVYQRSVYLDCNQAYTYCFRPHF